MARLGRAQPFKPIIKVANVRFDANVAVAKITTTTAVRSVTISAGATVASSTISCHAGKYGDYQNGYSGSWGANIVSDATPAPARITVTTIRFNVTVRADQTLAPSVRVCAATSFAVTIHAGDTIPISAIGAIAAIRIPTVTVTSNATVTPARIVCTGLVRSVAIVTTIAPASFGATSAVYTPNVVTTVNATATPSVHLITVTRYIPNVATNNSAGPTRILIIAAVNTPGIITGFVQILMPPLKVELLEGSNTIAIVGDYASV